jgi:hypothetical protein
MADGEPAQAAVENAQQIAVVRAQAVGGIGQVDAAGVQGEARRLADVREDE